MPTTPVIILNWNGLNDTIECLDSVFATQGADFQLFILDNASSGDDFTQLSLRYGKDPRVLMIRNSENLGFTKAHNRVFEEHILPNAAYKQVVLLNNDTVVDPLWLSSLLSRADSEQAQLVGSKMINYYDRNLMDNAGHRMINTGEIVAEGVGKPKYLYNDIRENMGTCAGATLYDVDMLRTIGIFDEYFITGYEDAELGVRAKILGYKSILDPDSIVYHKGSASIKKIVNYEYILCIQSSVYYTYLKLMPLGVLLVNLPSFLVKYLAILIIDIVFMRWTFLKALFHSIYRVLIKEKSKVQAARKNFHKNHKLISNVKILGMQEFFLLFDIKRFYKDVLMRNKPLLQQELDKKG